MTTDADHYRELVSASFATAPSNQEGCNVVATLTFGETVVRLPHRTLRFCIDTCYLSFQAKDCSFPESSWEFAEPIPISVVVTRTAETSVGKKSSGKSAGSLGGDMNSINVPLSASHSREVSRENRTTTTDAFSIEAQTITTWGNSGLLNWKIQAPPGAGALVGPLLDNSTVLRAVPSATGASIVISGEIPRGAISLVDTKTRTTNKNKAGLSRMILSLTVCDRPFKMAELHVAGAGE